MVAAAAISGVAKLSGHGHMPGVRRADLGTLLVSSVFLSAHYALWITSLGHTSVASSTLLVTTTPVFVALGSVLLIREQLNRVRVCAIAISIAGGLILASGDWATSNRHLYGDVLALAAAPAIGGYILIGRRLRPRIPTLSYSATVYAMSAVILLALAIGKGAPMGGLPLQSYFWMGMAGLIPQALGGTLINWVLGYWRATDVALAVRGEPVIATLLAIPVLHEIPSWTIVPGGVLVMLGVYLAVTSESMTKPEV